MQTTSDISTERVANSLPDPGAIRARLAEIRQEARFLRELLPVAEKSARLASKQTGQEQQKGASR